MAEDVVILSRRAVVASVLVFLLLGGVFFGGLFRQQQSIDEMKEHNMVNAWVGGTEWRCEVGGVPAMCNSTVGEPQDVIFRPEAPDNWIANETMRPKLRIVYPWGNWETFTYENGVDFQEYYNTVMNTTYVFVNDSVGWIYMQDRNGQWWKVN